MAAIAAAAAIHPPIFPARRPKGSTFADGAAFAGLATAGAAIDSWMRARNSAPSGRNAS
jgi:hypothetical protein